LTNPLGKSALKVLLGLVFVVSAVLKLFDMDKFEIYIYSYHFFSLNASFMVARLAIIIELVLGIGLISHCLHKLMWWGSIAMLTGYSLLLIYAMYLGRTDSCHCFGDFLQLDPKQSLMKNGVLMLLFLPIYRMESWKTPFRWLILCLTVMVSTIAVFVISPPDNLTSNADPEQNLQLELFNEMLDDAPLDALNLREGKQVICFFSTSCEVCQLAAHKLSLMQQFYDFPKENITYLFMGNEESIAKFYEESGSAQYRDLLYHDVARLLKAVNGNFPVIVFLEDGEVVHEYGFRNMNEAEIQAFMII
jgi:thiol-disulfide isomerase/thioredoxin